MQQVFEHEYNIKWVAFIKKFYDCSLPKWSQRYFSRYEFCQNPNVDMEIILAHLNEDWDWVLLCSNPNMTIDFIMKYHPKFKNSNYLFDEFKRADVLLTTRYADVATLDEINRYVLSNYWNHIRYIGKLELRSIWWDLSYNKNITFDVVLKFRDKPWHWDVLSQHKNITFQMIMENLDLPWYWNHVGANPNVTMENILHDYPNIQRKHCRDDGWNWKKISRNPNFNPNLLITNNPNKFFQYWICRNPAITWDFVLQHPEIQFDEICANPNIPIELLEKHKQLTYFNYYTLSANPNLSINYVLKNINKRWDYFAILRNPMTIDKNNYVETQYMRIILATIYEFYQSPTNYHTDFLLTSVEYIFADDFLVKMIICNVL